MLSLEEREAVAAPQESGEDSGSEGDIFERVGVTVIELSPMARQNFRIEEGIEGVVVTRVRPLSPASEEGMQPGLVITEANGEPIDNPAELRSVVEDVEAGGYLRLYVYIPRADSYRFVILKLEE